MVRKPTLYLLPNLLAPDTKPEDVFPSSLEKIVDSLDGLISESEKAGRRYLSLFKIEKKPRDVPIAILDEHTHDDDLDFLLEPIRKGEKWGIISDAGLPCLADPGDQRGRATPHR